MKIQNTKELGSDGIKIVVAGEAGNGKTTLARTLVEGLKDEKTCIVSAEAGLLSLRGTSIDVLDITRDDEEKPIPKEKRIDRLVDIFKWLSEPEQIAKYHWIFLDSLTEINQNLLEQLEKDPEFQGPKNTIKKFGELSTRMRSICKAFRDLPHYNVVFTALVKEDTDNDGKKTMVVDLIGSFAAKLPALFDEIFYLGVTSEIDERGRNKRKILTQKTDKMQFPKDRSDALDRLEEPDLAAIVKKIRGKLAAKAAAESSSPTTAAPPSKDAVPTPATTQAAQAPNTANVPGPLVADISAAGKAAAAEAKAQKSPKH